MRTPLPLIPESEWNDLLGRIQRAVTYARGRDRASSVRHAWNVALRWDAERERYEYNVRAGYVNAAQVSGPELETEVAPFETLARLAAEGVRVEEGDRVRPWLSERAWFPIAERVTGIRDIAGEPERVRRYLAQFTLDGAEADPLTPASERRLLRAVDLVLTVPRPAVRTSITDGPDGIGLSADLVSAPEGGPRLEERVRFEPAAPVVSLIEQIATGRVDLNFEARLIATIYFVGPRGVLSESAPLSPAWIPFPFHRVFYNQAFSARVNAALVAPNPLALSVPLAGGVAQLPVDAILAEINLADAEAALLLSQAGVAARFWDV